MMRSRGPRPARRVLAPCCRTASRRSPSSASAPAGSALTAVVGTATLLLALAAQPPAADAARCHERRPRVLAARLVAVAGARRRLHGAAGRRRRRRRLRGPPTAHVNPLLVLMAQAVPTASRVPCVGVVPVLLAPRRRRGPRRPGRLRVRLELGRRPGRRRALGRPHRRAATSSGATEVPSDEPGTQRFERLRECRRRLRRRALLRLRRRLHDARLRAAGGRPGAAGRRGVARRRLRRRARRCATACGERSDGRLAARRRRPSR